MSQVTETMITQWVEQQQDYYESGETRSLQFRIQQLKKLKQAIVKYQHHILDALYLDLRKSKTEGYASELGLVLYSISHMIKNLRRFAKPKRVKTPLPLIGTASYIVSEPYGSVLIIGPFNYPASLILEPLVAAIASGNCAIVKPSEHTPNVSAALRDLITETFDTRYIRLVEGAQEETSWLIHAPFDYIFFTGSTKVGKIVAKAAAERLIPVTLELGGKSPVIVDRTAKLEIAAQRVVWGKLLNNGQTCIAPDYILVEQSIYEPFMKLVVAAIHQFYSSNPLESEDYGRIVSDTHFLRLKSMLEDAESDCIYGGQYDEQQRYIAPTFLSGGTCKQPRSLKAMQEEVFGPICTVIQYDTLDEAITFIKQYDKPLALYAFTEDAAVEQRIVASISFGGGCINDTLSHYINYELPFGGVGPSGLGAYHGEHSFEQFTHRKSMLKRTTLLEPGILFPPYKDKLKFLRKVLK
ncbi:MAG TPA: aldehyde dehydrogenase [Candidatus Paenibacillus intestinavium]|nr:aldehyde dehydrogenase [Candidatus Paenibacillus intestinavium]